MFKFYKRVFASLNDPYNDQEWNGFVYLSLGDKKPSRDDDYHNFTTSRNMTISGCGW